MSGFFQMLASFAVIVFSVSTMLATGLGHTLRHVFRPMRDARGTIRALLANYVLVPLWALLVIRLLPLDQPYRIGLMLIACAAGAPFLIRLVMAAGGNVALSASLTMFLLPLTVLLMPLAVPVIVPEVRVNALAIGLPLLWTMIVPMAVGLAVRARYPKWAKRLQPWTAQLSSVALVTLIVASLLANLGPIVRLARSAAILAILLVILGAFVLGYALGREYRGGHVVQGFGAAQRNIAAAMVVATQVLDDQRVVLMVVVASLVDLAVLFPLAWVVRRLGLGQQGMAPA